MSVEQFEKIVNFILQNIDKEPFTNYENDNPHYKFEKFDVYLAASVGQRNINNDPKISTFNERIIKNQNQYFHIILVRKGDLRLEYPQIQPGMQEQQIYYK